MTSIVRPAFALMVVTSLAVGCQQLRPGPRRSGPRATVYENTPIDDRPDARKFQYGPDGPRTTMQTADVATMTRPGP